MSPRPTLLLFGLSCLLLRATGGAATPAPEIAAFTDRYCSSCHNDVDQEAGLDLTTLTYAPDDPANFARWVKIHDRVQNGEMPPREKRRPDAKETARFIGSLAASLTATERRLSADGRATQRRLNRAEYENALRDLLHAPWIQVQALLPEDGESHHFNKSSAALDVSYVHMTQYMAAADAAMREAMSVQLVHPATTKRRYYARETRNMISGDVSFKLEPFTGFGPDRLKFPALGSGPQPDVRAGKAPLTVGDTDPATRDLEAVGWVSSHLVTGFGTSWSSFIAPVAGRYLVRFDGLSLWVGPGGHSTKLVGTGKDRVRKPDPDDWFKANYDLVTRGRRSEPITLYAQSVPLTPLSRKVAEFDVHPDASVSEVEVNLMAKEWLVTDAARFYRSRPTVGSTRGYTNPLAQRDGQPAVAFRWMEVEGPLYDENTTAGYRLMFGDLPLRRATAGQPGVSIDVVQPVPKGKIEPPFSGSDVGLSDLMIAPVTAQVISSSPAADAERLLRGFIARAYRRPVEEKDVQRFLGLVQKQLGSGAEFTSAMLCGYTAVLASPEFVFVRDNPGRLDDYALATRLALFLWNSEPDETLRAHAERHELQRSEVLRSEVDRMIRDPKSVRFVEAFTDQWLDLRKMDETTPSIALYPDYQLDQLLMQAATDETRLFFRDLLQRDLPARNVVDSDFTFLNERLAQHYGLSGVDGVAMRRVALPANSPRGGLMTQASVMKVTAAGTTTSPVWRGKWVMERILGFEMPLPPASVPAVEPDIRGAITIRQQLEKHRADESCAVCHRKIDPPGFALESFDIFGGYRERYRATSPTEINEFGFGRNGHPFAFYYAQPVDASGQMPDGRAFDDIHSFKQLLLQDEAQLARNLVQQFTIYATGTAVRFSDREAVAAILMRAKPSHYGVRTLVHELVQSDLFRNK